jgi:kynurenine formamidase
MTGMTTAGRNWGRWGDGDERGAPNLLTPQVVAGAAGLVRSGDVYSLAVPLDSTTPVPAHRPCPAHYMLRDGGDRPGARLDFADDVITLPAHGGTHIDSLAHVWYDGRLFNDFPSATVTSRGARHCGADKLGPIVGRGVLLDVARSLALDAVEPGRTVTADDLARCAESQGTELRSGDIVLIRTGWWAGVASSDDLLSEPGPDSAAATWLADRDPAAVGADNIAFEVTPAVGGRGFPVHELLLRDCGVPILECLALDALAAAGVHEFMFAAAPVAFRGATAGPIHPVAIA